MERGWPAPARRHARNWCLSTGGQVGHRLDGAVRVGRPYVTA